MKLQPLQQVLALQALGLLRLRVETSLQLAPPSNMSDAHMCEVDANGDLRHPGCFQHLVEGLFTEVGSVAAVHKWSVRA